MARQRIIYRLLSVFILFALLVVVPYTVTIVSQAQKIIARQMQEHAGHLIQGDAGLVHSGFAAQLLEHMIPYVFFIVILAFLLSVFFMRSLIFSIRQLLHGAEAIRDGNLDVRLPVVSRDELGSVTRTFNEMTEALSAKTRELAAKNVYINAMHDPLWVVDEENRVADINPAFTKMFGYSRDEVLGRSIFDFIDDRNAIIMREHLDARRDNGTASTYEISVLDREGHPIPVLVSGAPLFEGKRVRGQIGILKDFREQAALRSDLQQSFEFVRTVMDSIEDEIVVIDRTYRIIGANRAATDHNRGTAVGSFCHTALHRSDVPCWADGHECPAQIVFATGQPFRITHRHVSNAGGYRSYEVMASPVRDAAGNVVHVIELMRDVTERISFEAELSLKNRELTAINNIAGILSRSLKPDEILTQVLERMIEMMKMDGGGIFFIDDAAREMTCRYHRGISDEYVKMFSRIRLGEDIPGRVAVTGHAITSSDITRDFRIERTVIKHSGIRGYCCYPIRGKERVIGVFCIFSFGAHVFTPEEERILGSISEMTGLAIENIRLYEKVRDLYEFQRRRRAEEHSQLIALSARLGSADEPLDVLNPVLELIRESFQADFAWLLFPGKDGDLEVGSVTSVLRGLAGVACPAGVSSVEGFALSRRQPVIVSNLRTESKYALRTELSSLLHQSVLSVPLFIGDKAVGVLSLYYLGVKAMKEEEVHFLEIIANTIAVSLERSAFYRNATAEKELADTILHSVTDGIVTVDLEGKVISVNRAMEEMVGILSSMAVGRQLSDIFRFSGANDGFRAVLDECTQHALRYGTTAAPAEILTFNARSLSVGLTSSPILDIHGKPTGVVHLIRDISREKEVDRMKTEIVRSVSSEFRAPLSAIVGMTEMILSGDVGRKKEMQYLEIIRSEGARLAGMVNELLDIARIEAGTEGLMPERFRLKDLLDEVRETLLRTLEEKRAFLRYDGAAAVELVADRKKIKGVLINLIENSLTFSDEGCMIDVRGLPSGPNAGFSVSDTGWGIPADDLPHLAERFFRGSNGTRAKGTGLGLSLVAEIVTMHGGGLSFESVPGRGTTVTVKLPQREET